MRGVVKWFDPEAGYGIIRTDQGVDILVQRGEIPPHLHTLVADQSVQFDMLFPPQGAEATIVRLPGSTPFSEANTHGLTQGRVRAFDEQTGRGFIRTEDGREVSVRRQAIQKSKATLEPGEEVELDWLYATQRIEAINVVTLDGDVLPSLPTQPSDPAGGVPESFPAVSRRELRVFLCHSSMDKAKVRQLRQRLRALPVLPWLDEEQILPGQEWELEIGNAIRTSHVILVCLSAASAKVAGFLQREIRLALEVAANQPERTICVIPVRFDDCALPERLKHLHRVDLWDVVSFSRLTASLRLRAQELGLSWN